MPVYSYKCDSCGEAADRFRSIARQYEPAPCKCGGEAHYQWQPTRAMIMGGHIDTVINGRRYEGSATQVAAQLRQDGLTFKSDYIDKTAPQEFGIRGIDNRTPPSAEARRIYEKALRAKTDGTAAKMIKQTVETATA